MHSSLLHDLEKQEEKERLKAARRREAIKNDVTERRKFKDAVMKRIALKKMPEKQKLELERLHLLFEKARLEALKPGSAKKREVAVKMAINEWADNAIKYYKAQGKNVDKLKELKEKRLDEVAKKIAYSNEVENEKAYMKDLKKERNYRIARNAAGPGIMAAGIAGALAGNIDANLLSMIEATGGMTTMGAGVMATAREKAKESWGEMDTWSSERRHLNTYSKNVNRKLKEINKRLMAPKKKKSWLKRILSK